MDSTDRNSHMSTRLQNNLMPKGVPNGRNTNFFRISSNMDRKRISYNDIRIT